MPPTVIASPHPDDAVLSLWHLLAGPGEVVVVNVFGGSPERHSGDAWWDRMTGAGDSVARTRERHAEDRAALALAGREPRNLGFLDGQYRRRPPAVEEVAERLDAALPAGAALLAPASLDDHRDHIIARGAALALRDAGREVRLYADVPHCVTFGWPAWVTGAPPAAELHPEEFWQHNLRGTGISLADCEADVRHLDAGALAAKARAMQTYRTQLAALEAAWRVESDPEVLRHEVVWALPD